MKAKQLIYSLVAGSMALSFTACDDFLDTVPDNRVELSTTEHLRKIMNAAYPQTNWAWPCELSSDNMEDNNAPDENGVRYNLSAYDRGDEEMFAWEPCKSNTDIDSPSSTWMYSYLSIAHCNAVLERIEEIEESGQTLDGTQKAIKGEALVLRAYNHFILANTFCQQYAGPVESKKYLGIPYITKPETTVKPHYERGTLDQTYESIRADLEAGLPLIDNSLYTIPKYHFNTQAANAFAARFYLFTREYDKCLEHCNLAFGGESTDASMYLSDIWSRLGDFYSLTDFGLYNQGIDKAHNFLLIPTYSIMTRRLSGQRRYSIIRNAACGTMQGSGPTWWKFKFVNDRTTGGSFTMNPCFNGCSFMNGSSSEYGLLLATNISEHFEYTNKVAGIGYCHVTRSEFNGAETLLTRAEAKLFLGDIEGCFQDLKTWDLKRQDNTYAKSANMKYEEFTRDLLEQFYAGGLDNNVAVRTEIVRPINIDQVCPSDKYSLTPDKEPYLQCIQHFRRIEMLHSGMRWLDIKRLGIEFSRKIGKDRVELLSLNDERRAIQLPQEVIAAGMQANMEKVPDLKVSDQPKYVVVK